MNLSKDQCNLETTTALVTSSTASLHRPGVGVGVTEADGADAGAGTLHVFDGEEFLISPTRCSTLVQSTPSEEKVHSGRLWHSSQ